MAMVPTAAASTPGSAAAAAATVAVSTGNARVLPASLNRCRQWLLSHRSNVNIGCPDRYDDNISIASLPRPTNMTSTEASTAATSSSTYRSSTMPLLRRMSGRHRRDIGGVFGQHSRDSGSSSVSRWAERIANALGNTRSLSRARMHASPADPPAIASAPEPTADTTNSSIADNDNGSGSGDYEERLSQPAQRDSGIGGIENSQEDSVSIAIIPRENTLAAARIPGAAPAMSHTRNNHSNESNTCIHVSDTPASVSVDSDQLRARMRFSGTASVGIETISEMDGLDDQSLNSLYCVDPESLDGERRQRQGQPLSPSMVPVSPMSMSTLDVRNNEYSNNRSSPAAAAAYRAWQRSCCLDDLRAANAESAPSDVFTSAYTRHMITRQSNMSPTTAVSATASSMQAFTADSHQGCNELAQHSSAIESRGEYVHPSRPLSDTVVSDAETYRPMSYTFSTDEQETYNSRYEAMDGSYTGDASEYIDYGQAFIENGHAIESEFGNGADSLRHELLDPDMTIQVPDHASLEQAGVLSDTTTSPTPNPAMPNASAIAQIFAIGQPTRPKGYKGMSKARRLSKRLLRALPKQLWPGGRYPHPLTEADRVCSDALLSTFTAESSLFNAIRLLERTRSTRSSSFRIRADRVHTSQSQLLNCIFELFIQLVPEEEQRSRHYRYYLPEDDQIELDRGFSESVLFAAQALARGFQIRGTEMHTQSLREPAWLLCSAWAAVRYVIFARGSSLWCIWDHGLMHQDEHEASTSPLPSSPASPSSSISPQDELGALRGVLEDFDEAWVKFERDLCFAYFGLSNAQPTGSVDSEQSDGQATQEEEFSLLVVLLSETLQRSIAQGLVSEEQMEAMEPQLILALPRLAILHAVAHGGVDGLQFVESEDTKVFWWFREYAELCRRASEEVGKWGAVRYEVLQNMLAAEEADIVWAESEDAVYMSLFGAKQALASEALSLPKPSQGLPANKMAKSTSASPSPIASPRIQLAPRLVASAAALQTPAAMDAKGAPRSRDMALCREKTRQVYVDICTVADSLHSGQFARPFRVALELVFRMNTATATASSHSASESS